METQRVLADPTADEVNDGELAAVKEVLEMSGDAPRKKRIRPSRSKAAVAARANGAGAVKPRSTPVASKPVKKAAAEKADGQPWALPATYFAPGDAVRYTGGSKVAAKEGATGTVGYVTFGLSPKAVYASVVLDGKRVTLNQRFLAKG